MQNTHSPKFLRKRKFMMVLPLLTLPFATLAFWALGGGKGNTTENKSVGIMGLNLQLPEPNLEDQSKENKLTFYNKAQEDSIKLRQEMKNDPYYRNWLDTIKVPESISINSVDPLLNNKLNQSTDYSSGTTNPNEAKIYERLAALNKAIQSPAETSNIDVEHVDAIQKDRNGDFSTNVDRLENMMQGMNEKSADDPEMTQLGDMLDKILDIQHPEIVKDKIREKSIEKKTQAFVVSNPERINPVTYLGTANKRLNDDTTRLFKHNGFYGTSSTTMGSDESNAIAAVIHQTQIVTSGSTVKLRLLTDIYINGNRISKGSFIFGTASLEDERLLISVPGIRYRNNLLQVSLSVYDMDGLAGVYIPGSISRDVAKQSADQSLQGIEMMSLDPSLKAQAASAGIQAAKGLLSKKIKLVKVTLKAGYHVLLKDGNKQEN